jgi:ribonucleoside-diphosphate reductase alpha chain
VVLEISVLMAQFPSKEVAQLSYDYRTLGLGYANLGTMLMVSGIPYDSPKATAICGALTSILTGNAYATSAEMAAALGTFRMYEKNKKHMLRVIRNHRYAAYNTPLAYEGLSVSAVGIDPKYCPENLLHAACNSWDKALKMGEVHGYRNAQTTVIAPTGTIGLLMDCDTTGIEPDFAMVKFKKLSGGGYFKIINQSIPAALKNLGYSKSEVVDIVNYAKGHGTFQKCPHINYQTLMAKGFSEADIEKLENGSASAFEIGFLFNQFVLGEDCLMRLGFKAEQYRDPSFNMLRALGFSNQQIKEANEFVCGTMTVEGAPHLKDEHLPVFDCANKCGNIGVRYILPHAHIRMMAAAQPFISGAISKTINLPNEASVEDIKSCYKLSWELGLKANALYRDGCKLSQPLSNKSDTKEEKEDSKDNVVTKAVGENAHKLVSELTPEMVLEAARRIINESNDTQFKRQLSVIVERKKLPGKRRGFTQKAKIDGNTIFVRTGEYADGTVGEIFVDMHREGASFRSLMNCFSIAVSIGLQYGVPLEEYVDKFTFTRFEPAGMVEGHDNIKSATSVVDYIFRVLGFEYLHREDLVHIKPVSKPIENKIKEDKQIDSNISEIPKANLNPVEQKVTSHIPSSGDSPACKNCGNITVRSGTCYTCLTCGSTTGCA